MSTKDSSVQYSHIVGETALVTAGSRNTMLRKALAKIENWIVTILHRVRAEEVLLWAERSKELAETRAEVASLRQDLVAVTDKVEARISKTMPALLAAATLSDGIEKLCGEVEKLSQEHSEASCIVRKMVSGSRATCSVCHRLVHSFEHVLGIIVCSDCKTAR